MIPGSQVGDLAFLLLLSVSLLPLTPVFLTVAFLLFPDGVNLISVDGEAQDQGQGEAEVKGSISQKKAVATLKVSGYLGERIVLGFWPSACH